MRSVRSSGYTYSNRELLKYCLNPVMLCKLLPWYEEFLLQTAMIRENIRLYGIGGKMDPSVKGFNHSRTMRKMSTIPSQLIGAIEACDPGILDDERKHEAFLADFPEFDLRVVSK